MAAKSERLDIRLTPEQKEALERTAALVGTTVSGLVVQAALDYAQGVLARQQVLVLSERDSRALAEALANPPAPNAALRRTVAHYERTLAAE